MAKLPAHHCKGAAPEAGAASPVTTWKGAQLLGREITMTAKLIWIKISTNWNKFELGGEGFLSWLSTGARNDPCTLVWGSQQELHVAYQCPALIYNHNHKWKCFPRKYLALEEKYFLVLMILCNFYFLGYPENPKRGLMYFPEKYFQDFFKRQEVLFLLGEQGVQPRVAAFTAQMTTTTLRGCLPHMSLQGLHKAAFVPICLRWGEANFASIHRCRKESGSKHTQKQD